MGKPFFNVVVVVAERVVVESGWQVCRIHFTGKLVKVSQTLVEHEQLFSAMLLCNLLCKAQLFNQRIDVAPSLLVCPKYDAIVNNERLVVSEFFRKPQVAVNVGKRHVAKSADVVLTQHKHRGDLLFFQLF